VDPESVQYHYYLFGRTRRSPRLGMCLLGRGESDCRTVVAATTTPLHTTGLCRSKRQSRLRNVPRQGMGGGMANDTQERGLTGKLEKPPTGKESILEIHHPHHSPTSARVARQSMVMLTLQRYLIRFNAQLLSTRSTAAASPHHRAAGWKCMHKLPSAVR
jgi:hypothetical protein